MKTNTSAWVLSVAVAAACTKHLPPVQPAPCKDAQTVPHRMPERGLGALAKKPAQPIPAGELLPAALSCASLPATGSLGQFIPTGWESISQASADLSGDGVADKAILICPAIGVRQAEWESQYFSCGACVPSELDCAALVLAGRDDGFDLWAVEALVHISAQLSVRLSVDGAILMVDIEQSGHFSSRTTQLKYRRRGAELALIGTELTALSAPAEEEFVSINWLTRQQKRRSCSEGECGRWESSRTPDKMQRFGDGMLRGPVEP